MKNKNLFIGVAVLVIIGVAVFGLKGKSGTTNPQQRQETGSSTTSGGKRTTAKPAYDLALKEAKKSALDGYLVDMYSLSSSYNKTYTDGTSETWYFVFHSAAKKQYRVRMDGGKVASVTDISGTKTVEIPAGWLDSDQAAKIGAEKCNGAPENSYFFSISTKTDNKSFVWSVSCEIDGKKQTIRLDAFSGKVE